EEMVFESRVGETFVLGATSWRIEEITHDRVLVSPAPGMPGRMPFWKGDPAGRPVEFGRAVGALCRTLRELGVSSQGSVGEGKGSGFRVQSERRTPNAQCLTPNAAYRLLTERHSLTAGAARNL